MDLIAYLVSHGLERWLAALLTLSAAFCALLLPGIAVVAFKEGWRPLRGRTPRPRGATRINHPQVGSARQQ